MTKNEVEEKPCLHCALRDVIQSSAETDHHGHLVIEIERVVPALLEVLAELVAPNERTMRRAMLVQIEKDLRGYVADAVASGRHPPLVPPETSGGLH